MTNENSKICTKICVVYNGPWTFRFRFFFANVNFVEFGTKKWPACQRGVEQDYFPMKISKQDPKPAPKPGNLRRRLRPKDLRRKVDPVTEVRPR